MKDLDNIEFVNSMARAAIVDEYLYVKATRAHNDDHRRKILGVLSSIHRALVTNPGVTIASTEFVFSVEDKLDDVAGPQHPLWILARKPDEESVWLMPDFGFWSWNNDHTDRPIGPYNAVVDRIVRREKDEYPWDEKKPKLVWRRKLSFAAKMRRGLLEAARDQPWDDVKELGWHRRENFMTMEDHCQYRYIAHVEDTLETPLYAPLSTRQRKGLPEYPQS
ncbi:uncharacterized protein KD926_009546 [Aspergillus affinis]|uniref:uncharacterized protein n=1 Tax=Aspergillus affinis TaxID=1070780 RepID=UPI0022FF03EA|nr:uncharacterized protein KD926_009546 [Aspergillus affinis]KAI9045132.1 hypothetical protein KD926_009546 [Aspergillus affinis]